MVALGFLGRTAKRGALEVGHERCLVNAAARSLGDRRPVGGGITSVAAKVALDRLGFLLIRDLGGLLFLSFPQRRLRGVLYQLCGLLLLLQLSFLLQLSILHLSFVMDLVGLSSPPLLVAFARDLGGLLFLSFPQRRLRGVLYQLCGLLLLLQLSFL